MVLEILQVSNTIYAANDLKLETHQEMHALHALPNSTSIKFLDWNMITTHPSTTLSTLIAKAKAKSVHKSEW